MGIEFNGEVPKIILGEQYEDKPKKAVTLNGSDVSEKLRDAIRTGRGVERTGYLVPATGKLDIDAGTLFDSLNTPPVDLPPRKPGESIEDYLSRVLKPETPKTKEPTPEQKEARAKLDQKVSSTGITYGDATKTIEEIQKKYDDDKYKSEVTIYPKQNPELLIYHEPYTVKRFDANKLPEPARTLYKESMDAKVEIENNNKALAKKAGIIPADVEAPVEAPPNGKLDGILGKLGLTPATPKFTEKQKAAQEKLNAKTSSTGQTYKEANAKLAELREKHKNCTSMFEQKQPELIAIYYPPVEGFDPYKMPEPDKSAYFEALESVIEIEEANSALLKQAGLQPTGRPSQDYAHTKMPAGFKLEHAKPDIELY